jgi:hypothetical protein
VAPPRRRLGTIPGIISIVVLLIVLAAVVAAQASTRPAAQGPTPAPVTIPTPTTSGLDPIREDVDQLNEDLQLILDRLRNQYDDASTMRACQRLLDDVETAQTRDTSELATAETYEETLDTLHQGATLCVEGNVMPAALTFSTTGAGLTEVIDELNGLNS